MNSKTHLAQAVCDSNPDHPPHTEFNIQHAEQARELIPYGLDWVSRGHDIALLTLINIEGNAPYPVGTQMLVNDTGEFVGQITGGCAETALAQQALTAINAKQNVMQRYGLNSPFFDIQLPCGSGIDVFFDVGITHADLLAIQQSLGSRRAYTQTLDTPLGQFEKTYLPTERLILFGQGPILVNLARLAVQSGFDVVCFAYTNDTVDMANDRGIAMNPLVDTKLDYRAVCDRYSAVVSLFHEHELELELLTQALASDVFYVGALGSKRTHAARLESLSAAGVSAAKQARVHGPVGLDINAISPAQIAISILADVVRQLNG